MPPFRASEEDDKRYRTIFDSDLIGIIATNFNGVIYDANDYFLKMLGYTREDLGNLNWKVITAPEYLEQSIAVGDEIFFKGKAKTFEKEYLHKDGHRVPVMVGLTHFRDDTIIALILDITERKKSLAEAEARAQQLTFMSEMNSALSETFDEKKILEIFCHSSTSFFSDICLVDLINEDGLDFDMAEIACRDTEDCEIIRAWRTRHPIRWDAEEGVGKVAKTGNAEIHNNIKVELFLERNFSVDAAREEEAHPVHISSILMLPIRFGKQKTFGVAVFFRKNPDRPFQGVDLSIGDALVRRLAIAMDNSRLYYNAQEASHAKTAFLANVSHEIRTPLGAMLGFADLIQEDPTLTKENQDAIKTIIRNGQQLLRIVDEILDISKVESDKIVLENIPFELGPLLEDVIHLLRPRAEEKGLHLLMHAPRIPKKIVTDPTRLRQILINVIGNAIKFTDSGTVELQVKVKTYSPEVKRGCLEFSVVDTGIGIPLDQRANLFQPFQQADSSTTRRFGGTGLGLFLSRKLARLLGGDVSLDSSSQTGSRFVITIQYEMAPEISQAESAERRKLEFRKNKICYHILVVDDASDNRELFKHYLKKFGYAEECIDLAENGSHAVQMASVKQYSLVLMDIQMPIMDGFQALAELKRLDYPGPIVALTAHAMKGDEEKCLAAGFDGYLQKPLSREALKKVLDKHIEHPAQIKRDRSGHERSL